MMSTMPQPVWNLDTVNVFSGLRKLMRGRLVWLVMPRFSLSSSLVEHAGVAGFRAGSRNRQHRADRKRLIGRGAGRSELPGVAACGDAHANALGGIEDRAAADRQDEVDALALAQLDARGAPSKFEDSAPRRPTRQTTGPLQKGCAPPDRAGRRSGRSTRRNAPTSTPCAPDLLELGGQYPFESRVRKRLRMWYGW